MSNSRWFVGAGVVFVAIVASANVSGAALSQTPTPPRAMARDRSTVLLAINDVYRIEGLEDGAMGGLARVRALRKELEREAPDLLMLHGGDFLFPSFASRMYRGEQMIAALNALDGDNNAFDPRMFVVFGNHEFERPKLKDAALLKERIDGSQFHWLGGNMVFANGPDGKPVVASKNLSRTALLESGGIRIGIIGLTIPSIGVEYISEFQGEEAVTRPLVAELRARGAEFVIALTHLNAATDRHILDALGDAGPDLIIGGHDHESMEFQVKGRWVLKADSDARTATVVRLTMKAAGGFTVKPELRTLAGTSPVPDPASLAVVNEWQSRHERDFCANAKASPTCLGEVYGHTRTDLGAEENKIRSHETSMGDWIADRMIDAFKTCGAQVAFVNSGSLRLNSDIRGGSAITRRHIEELLAYPTPLYLVKIGGATLASVVDHSVRGWPGSGPWLQIGGFAYAHDATARTATRLTWAAAPSRSILPTDSVLAVTGDYLISPDGDQDGYLMLNKGQIVDCAANGTDLKTIVIHDLKAAEPMGIAPRVEGRICQGDPRSPCLIPGQPGG